MVSPYETKRLQVWIYYLSCQNLGQRNSLPFTARNTTNELISNQSFLRVLNAERIQNFVSLSRHKHFLICQFGWSFIRDFVAQGEFHGSVDRERREM